MKKSKNISVAEEESYNKLIKEVFSSNPETSKFNILEYGSFFRNVRKFEDCGFLYYLIDEKSVINNKINNLLYTNYKGDGKYIVEINSLNKASKIKLKGE